MKAYNGFPGDYRAGQYAKLKQAWDLGTVARPTVCEVCGQTEGTINAHSEDYTRIFNAHHLCVVCHLAIHCRFHMRTLWASYRAAIRDGYRAPGKTQPQVMGFLHELQRTPAHLWPGTKHDPRGATLLDTLADHKTIHPNAEQFENGSREHPPLF